MFNAFEWMMARRYLQARRQESFISVIAIFSFLGICLGVATLIIVMSVMNGFRSELLDRILGLNGHIMVQNYGGEIENYNATANILTAMPGVARVTPLVEGQALATHENNSTGTLVRGIDPELFKEFKAVSENIVDGSLMDFGGRNAVVIGAKMARKLGLKVGDPLTLIAPEGVFTPFGLAPRLSAYEIVATFEIGMYEYDSTFSFLPLREAQIFFRTGDAVSGIEVMLDDAEDVDRVRFLIREALGGFVGIVDWRQMNANFFNALQVERNVMFLILTLIILVAAFNIISSLIMLVKDKSKDIAILRTMGASRKNIVNIFLIAGASVGVFGTISGLALGLLFCSNIESIQRFLEGFLGTDLFAAEVYFLSQLPAKIDIGEVALVVTMALVLSLLATIYPAWRAGKLDPVEALRYE